MRRTRSTSPQPFKGLRVQPDGLAVSTVGLVTRAPHPASPGKKRGEGKRRATAAASSAASRSLQAFSRHFQIFVVPMPSFSKDSLGGFMEFQEVAIDPNEKRWFPNFWSAKGRHDASCRRRKATQAVGRFRLRSDYFACELENFACETILFRQAPRKLFEIVGARNIRFRGFVRFQGFTRHIVSRFLRRPFSYPPHPPSLDLVFPE
jgi:hypothetical protein